MKKIIIVGHNQENCERLESLFHSFGMKQALPSRREGLTPIQIGELLNKVVKLQEQQLGTGAHQDTGKHLLSEKSPTHINKRQAKKHLKKKINISSSMSTPKSTWDYIPMDLLIANIDNEFWGWADKNALDHLEYWKKIDPSILFVLAYDHPQSLLLELKKHESNIDKDIILEKLNDWQHYNTKMLEFLEKNPERAILVSNERVKQQNRNSIKTIYNKILPAELIEKNDVNIIEIIEEQKLPSSSIDTMIANSIIAEYPEIVLLYRKLQQASNLPNIDNASSVNLAFEALKENKMKDNILKERENAIVNKEKEIVRLIENENLVKDENKKLIDKLKFKEGELENLVTVNKSISDNCQKISLEKKELDNQLQIVLEQLEKINAEKQKIETDRILSEKEKNDFLEKNKSLEMKLSLEKEELSNQIKSISNENEQLLFQLHLVQEELEKLYKANKKVSAEKQKIETDIIISEKEKNDFLEKNKSLEMKLSLEKEELSNQIKSISNENEQLLFQLHLVQEELEKSYKANKKLKERPLVFGAASRIKNQLDYRIGVTLIHNSASIWGWLKLPFSLLDTYLQYQKWYRENKTELLTPIESYQDYYEVHRLKKHLSYRLGQVFLSGIKNPLAWFMLPVRLYKEVKIFRKEKAK